MMNENERAAKDEQERIEAAMAELGDAVLKAHEQAKAYLANMIAQGQVDPKWEQVASDLRMMYVTYSTDAMKDVRRVVVDSSQSCNLVSAALYAAGLHIQALTKSKVK